MTHSFSRRAVLKGAGSAALAFGGLASRLARAQAEGVPAAGTLDPYGPLIPDPYGALDLPEGFFYTVLSQTGDRMDDGSAVPARPDGMAAFPATRGRIVLVRNHELEMVSQEGSTGRRRRAGDPLAERVYDPGGPRRRPAGGTTTLVFDPARGRIETQAMSLAGTLRNCAGGPTPWGTWLSCEEAFEGPGDGLAKPHGYVFEVPASVTPTLVRPVPLTAMGRFRHEAAAVDPRDGAVYMTEDRPDGLFYRYVPNEPGLLSRGGRLQALALTELVAGDTRNWDAIELNAIAVGQGLTARWVDIEDPDPKDDELRYQGQALGAAIFARGEGLWYGDGSLFFAATDGGREKLGQIWRYTPTGPATGTLTLFSEPNDRRLMANCDNLTVAPWGHLIVCEDTDGENHIRGITPDGELYTLARNRRSGAELAGACFSPGGRMLFVNSLDNGLTFAIRGPWHRIRRA